jgi:hypothetical protein
MKDKQPLENYMVPKLDGLIRSLKELRAMVRQRRFDKKCVKEWLEEDVKEIKQICDDL